MLSRLEAIVIAPGNKGTGGDDKQSSSRGEESGGIMGASSIRDVLSLGFLDRNETLIISGSIHSDMNDLARTLGKKAEREGAGVLMIKAGALFELLAQEGAGEKSTTGAVRPAQARLLVVENFGMKKLTLLQTRDFLGLMTERIGRSSTVITSGYLLTQWASHIPGSEEGKVLLNSLLKNAGQVVIGGKLKKKEKKPAPIDEPMQACG